MLLLLLLLGLVCYLAITGVEYVNEEGNSEVGIQAVHKLKADKKEWTGELTETVIRNVIEENARVNATKEYQSNNVQESNIAYSQKQGFSDIRSLIAQSYSKFREFDYYLPDSLLPADAQAFYDNRILQLKEWLDTEAKEQFSEKEKTYLLQKYEDLKTPLHYDYTDGWKQLFEYSATIVMITLLILGFLVAGIFSDEWGLKSNSILYSTYHGRGKAVWAKVKAGMMLTTVIYWGMMLLYSGIVLGILGADGADIAIQTNAAHWKSFYNLTYLQEYLLILVSGYLGSMFNLLLTMLVSAGSKSTVLAVIVPFALIFIPSFLSGINSSVVGKILGLLPDQLLQMKQTFSLFILYSIGGKVVGAGAVLILLYFALTLILCPILYQVYRKAEVK